MKNTLKNATKFYYDKENGYSNRQKYSFDPVEMLVAYVEWLEEVDIDIRLNDAIAEAYETKERLECIIMHPKTWNKITETTDWIDEKDISDNSCYVGSVILYSGIEVLRSLDIKEGEFKVL